MCNLSRRYTAGVTTFGERFREHRFVTGAVWLDLLATKGHAYGAEPIEPSQAPIWGFGRTLALERPDLPCVCIDLAPGDELSSAEALLAELSAPFEEMQTAWRSGIRQTSCATRP